MKSFTTKLKRLVTAALLPSVMFFSASINAGDKANKIIDNALTAYGGETLLALKNLRYTDTIQHTFKHQSGHSLQGPTSLHLNQIQIEVTLDLENQRSQLKRLTKLMVGYHDSRNITATHRIYKDGKGYNLDHFLQEYQEQNSIGFDNADLGYSQMLDPLIVKKLVADKNAAQWVDTAFIAGRAHDVLTIAAGTGSEYSVYIDSESGLLSRKLQKRGSNLRTYNFLQHQQAGGIVWAKQLLVGTADSLVYHSDNRSIEINTAEERSFAIPAHYQLSAPSKPVDVSSLTIRQLADGVYYAGKGWGYTLFIDAGDHYISAGAWGMSDRSDDWKKALDLVHETTGNNKPVKYHLVSHHHTDHMSELHDVLDHGAKILLHPSDIAGVRQFLGDRDIDDNQFIAIDGKTLLAEGKVMLFDVPNSQASHNLAIYLPEHKIVFSEDVFGSSLQNQHHSPRSWPHMDTYQRLGKFAKQLQELNLAVEQYVSSHHARILGQQDIDNALKVKLPSDETIIDRLFIQ